MKEFEIVLYVVFFGLLIASGIVNKKIQDKYLDVFDSNIFEALTKRGYCRVLLKRFRENTYCSSIKNIQTRITEISINAPEAFSTNVNMLNDFFIVYGIKNNQKQEEICKAEYSFENAKYLIKMIDEYNNISQ